MASDTRLGTRIKQARERLHWSQDQLATYAGVSRSAVNAWENHRGKPRNRTVVGDLLGINLDRDDDGRIEPLDEHTRAAIMRALAGRPELQRRVIGLMEGTITWPAADETEETNAG
jgi:transcriptional regulator with XRE-family HTH domain